MEELKIFWVETFRKDIMSRFERTVANYALKFDAGITFVRSPEKS